MARRFSREVGLLLMLSCLFFTTSVPAQQADRATITGLITDSSGAPIVGANVTIKNETTGVETAVKTSSAGDYTTPPLILGVYSVKAEKQGFEVSIQTGIQLRGGVNYRQDLSLKPGAVSETVEVKAQAELINPSNADISNTLGQVYYQNLPVIASQDMRLPEALLYAQPGFVPDKVGAGFSGTQFMSRMGGGQAGAVESYLDGAAFGQGGNTNLTFESSPPIEAISESTVNYSTFSAQIGLTSGGLVSYTVKSGTPVIHGSVYEFVNTNQLNATGETGGIPASPLHVNAPGFTIGGPVFIPKVYDGRKKTFFFFNYDSTYKTDGNLPNFGLTAPLDAFKAGNFSSLLGTTVLGTDVLGRPVYKGEIFNPSTSRTVSGIPVRDGYGFDPVTGLPTATANMIPSTDPFYSKVSAKYVKLIPEPSLSRAGLVTDNYQTPANDSYIHDKTVIARVDHSFSDWFKMATTVNWDTRPRITNCSQLGGCSGYPSSPVDTYIGNGYFQRIRDTIVHQQFDWIIRPTLFNHTTVAYESMDHPNTALASKQKWPEFLGLTGLVQDEGGAPQVDFSGSIPFSQLGEDQYAPDDRPHWDQVLDDVTWVTGKQQLKFGFDFRHFVFSRIGGSNVSGVWNFNDLETGGYDSHGNALSTSGNSFASFLLGQVDSASFEIDSKPSFRADYVGPWINDEIKITPKLTVTAGLRWDFQTSETEQHNELSNFNPNLANPGAGGIKGAMEFAGTGAGLSGRRSFMSPSPSSFGPRLAFAYQVPGKIVNVIRGGYGIYYASVNMNQFAASPDIGFSTVPTAPNATNGFAPAFWWDNGFPQSDVHLPPSVTPSIANGTGPTTLRPDSFNLPRYQNWTITAERQINNNMVLDVSYIGNHGTRLTNSPASVGLQDNKNNPSVMAQYGAALLTSSASSPAAVAAGITLPYPGFVGDVAQALRPWPQYQNIDYWASPTGASIYNALEVRFQRHFSRGLQMQASYTYSKFMSDDAENAMSHLNDGSPQNPANPHRGEWARNSDLIPNLLLIDFNYQLPFGHGQALLNQGGVVERFVGGWTWAGVLRYEDGRPLGIVMNDAITGLIFNNGVLRPNVAGNGKGDTSRGMNPNTDRFLVSSGWTAPAPLSFGNEPRTDPTINGFPFYEEDMSLIKDTTLFKENLLRIELEDSNIFNRHTWCNPNTNWSSPSFGQVSGQCDLPRRLELGAKLRF
jgi:Carboxypeptidase regulatory-like domain